MIEELINPAEISQISNLELLAKQVVEGFIIGLHKSPFHGFSVEFAEHRQYNPGESLRNLDWKVLARTDKMYVKKYEEETNLRCQVVIDASSSMFYPGEKERTERKVLSKIQFSVLAAAALFQLLKKQRDAFGLTLFSDKIDLTTSERSTSVHHHLLLSYLEKLLQSPDENKRTSAAESLHRIAESIHKRSLVVIFSDMMENAAGENDETENLFSALQHLRHNKHEVLLFHVTDKKKELNFEFENRPYRFVDMETGEQLKLQPAQVKDYYTEQMKKLFHQIRLRCGQYKIDLVEADINLGFSQILTPYLVKRTKMM